MTYSTVKAAAKDSLAVGQILSMVELHSRDIKIQEATVTAKKFGVQDAKLQLLPNLSVFAEADKASNMPVYSNGLLNKPEQHDVIHTLYQSGANMYFNIYNGLKTKNLIRIAKLDQELAEAELREQTATVKLKAVHLFFDLYLQRIWVDLIHADIKEKQQQAAEIKHLYDKGVVLQSDVIRAELEISKRKMTLLEITNDTKIINQQLNVLIGYDDYFEVLPKIDDLPTENSSLEEVVEDGLKNAYTESISTLHLQVASQKVSLTKSENAVQLGIVGSFQFSNPQIFLYPYNANWYNLGIIGVKASYNISSLYHNKNKIKMAKTEEHTAHIHHEKIKDDLRSLLFEKYHDYNEAKSYIEIKEQNVSYAQENMRIIKNAYFSQSSLITDLLDANLLTLQAKFELKQAHINVFKTYYALLFAKGNL